MKRKIVSFDLDPECDWRAALECGHYQHVRHDPPLISREWVTTINGRAAKIGRVLECKNAMKENRLIFDTVSFGRDRKWLQF